MASPPAKSLGQRLMEWRPLVAIYESRFWRRSGLFARIAGIHFDDEIATLTVPGTRIFECDSEQSIFLTDAPGACGSMGLPPGAVYSANCH